MFFLIYNFYSILIYYSTEPLPLQALAEVPGRSFCHSQVKHCVRLLRLNEQCRKTIKMMILRHCFSCCFNFYFFQAFGSVVVLDRRGLNNEFYISVHTVNTSAVSAVCIILRTQDADPVKDIRKILINCFLQLACTFFIKLLHAVTQFFCAILQFGDTVFHFRTSTLQCLCSVIELVYTTFQCFRSIVKCACSALQCLCSAL